MKFKYLLVGIVMFFVNTTILFSQKIADKQFSLISYDLSISNELNDELKDLEPYIKSIKVYNTPERDKLKAIFIHNVFYTLKDKLKEDLKIDILPINAFLDKVKYDDYGYPQTNIQNAIRKGNSPYYFKVQVNIESFTKKQSQLSPDQFKDLSFNPIVPKITIDITIYNKEGVLPVDHWVGIAMPTNPLSINEYLLKGFDNKEIELAKDEDNPLNNFYFLLLKAIDNVIQDYYTK